jgi:hypothetical protein
MSTHSAPLQGRRTSDAWLYAKPLWAGLAIVAMWLAVLFVGVFADNSIVHNTTGGTDSSVPVVVVVALAALVATIVVGARAFKAGDDADELRRALEDERKAREELAAQLAEFLRSVAQYPAG